MTLAEALRFSWDRLAEHPTKQGLPIQASDYGITVTTPTTGFSRAEPVTQSWSDLDIVLRRELFQSEQWEPVDEKPAMLILAEAYALDWSDPEPSEEDECPKP